MNLEIEGRADFKEEIGVFALRSWEKLTDKADKFLPSDFTFEV